MELELTLPDEIGVMTLPGAVFFPQALLPLHIFEPRYRTMLRDVLASHRLFAVAGLNPDSAPGRFEPPHRVGTVGIVRACQESEDGTSNLLLHGLARVQLLGIVTEEPYRRVRVRALASEEGASPGDNARRRAHLARLLAQRSRLGRPTPGEMLRFLQSVEDPGTFADLAAFNLCDDAGFRQKLLETLAVSERLRLLGAQLRREIAQLRLQRQLQGDLEDDQIENN
jgi:ATP-dependent Lon protease